MGTGLIIYQKEWTRDKSLIRWMGTGEIIYRMDGHGINHLSDGWARDKSFIRWMDTGVNYLLNEWARDKSSIKWMGTG